jgi:hypothetical protein
MLKKIGVVAVVLMLCMTMGAFAAETKSSQFPWMASYDQPGNFNLYASVGFYGYGIDVNVGPEIIIGKFDIAGIPLSWGVTVRGLVGFASFLGYASWIDWGVAPMATLHWGVDLGSIWKFDWYIGLGVGVSGSTGSYYSYLNSSGIGIGFASSDGVVWHFSNNFGLVVDYAYTGYVSAAGVGIQMKL